MLAIVSYFLRRWQRTTTIHSSKSVAGLDVALVRSVFIVVSTTSAESIVFVCFFLLTLLFTPYRTIFSFSFCAQRFFVLSNRRQRLFSFAWVEGKGFEQRLANG